MSHSHLDTDMYKLTMQQMALHLFPSTEVEYKVIVRSQNANLRLIRKEIMEGIGEMCEARFTPDELDFLRSIRFLKPDYINYLEDYRIKERYFQITEEEDQLVIRVKGDWVSTIPIEVPLLALISEAYCTRLNPERDPIEEGTNNLRCKINAIGRQNFRFSDFGTRRRFSKSWHKNVVETLSRKLPKEVFAGTSNLWLAKEYGLRPIGTMAHESIQVGQGLGVVQLAQSQKFMLESWAREYRGDLGIALTDTIGIDAFLRDFDLYLAKLYDGCRHDSGDPIAWGEKIIAHYKKLGIDPKTKQLVFSDNLTFPKAFVINDHFKDRALVNFGIGTYLTNDVGVKPLSIVMKLVRVNGNPVAKISDEPAKVICEDAEFLSYLKKVYGLSQQPKTIEDFLENQQTH